MIFFFGLKYANKFFLNKYYACSTKKEHMTSQTLFIEDFREKK